MLVSTMALKLVLCAEKHREHSARGRERAVGKSCEFRRGPASARITFIYGRRTHESGISFYFPNTKHSNTPRICKNKSEIIIYAAVMTKQYTIQVYQLLIGIETLITK